MSQPWWEVKLDTHKEEESRVTPELRLAVFQRDSYRCQKCGNEDLDQLTVHHVIFRSQGGTHTVDNLATLCGTCHMHIHAHRLDIMRVDGVWYFRDNLLKMEEIQYEPRATTLLVIVRLRRYSGGSLTRWRSAEQRGSLSTRARRLQRSYGNVGL